MTNVLVMDQRMAKRTKYHKIANVIIFSITILMMYTKNAWKLIIRALFTFFNKTSSEHHFSHSGIFRGKSLLLTFVDAGLRAINSFSAWTILKSFTAMSTYMIYIFASSLIKFIAMLRAKSCRFFSVISNLERFFTSKTNFKDHLCL